MYPPGFNKRSRNTRRLYLYLHLSYIYLSIYIYISVSHSFTYKGICYRDLLYALVRVGLAFSVRLLSLCLMLGLEVHRADRHKGKTDVTSDIKHKLGPTGISWKLSKTEWNPYHFLFLLTWWNKWPEARALRHMTMNLAQEVQKLKLSSYRSCFYLMPRETDTKGNSGNWI